MALFLRRHRSSDLAIAETRRTWTSWIVDWDGVDRAQDVADLNHLLHAAAICVFAPNVVANPHGTSLRYLGRFTYRV